MTNRLIIFVFLAPLLGVLLGGARIAYHLSIWRYEGEPQILEIRQGEGFASINTKLFNGGLISSTKVFYRYCQFKNFMTKFRAGKFEIPSGLNTIELVDHLLKAPPLSDQLTIPEGKNLYEIGSILEQHEILKAADFIAYVKNPANVVRFNIAAQTLEGFLYPDSYRFSKNSSVESIVETMVSNFHKQTKGVNLAAFGMTPVQIITLASIVEKETGAKHERAIIAGVYHNRLKKRMRLMADPTTIYGIWERYNGNLRKADLLEITPYNTYKISGLPAGPICNPGIDAIKATLAPEQHNFLYFVSKNDGTHIFSENYANHEKAVDEWQRNRTNREGKSWRNLKQ